MKFKIICKFFYFIGIMAVTVQLDTTEAFYNSIVTLIISLPSMITPILEIYNFASSFIKERKLKKKEKAEMFMNKVILDQRQACM